MLFEWFSKAILKLSTYIYNIENYKSKFFHNDNNAINFSVSIDSIKKQLVKNVKMTFKKNNNKKMI